MAFDIYKYVHENKFNVKKPENGFKHGQVVTVTPKDGKSFKAKVAKTQISENTVNLGENGTWPVSQVKAIKKLKKEAGPKMKENPDVENITVMIKRIEALDYKYGHNQKTKEISKRVKGVVKTLEDLKSIIRMA